MEIININKFIADHITKRKHSFFQNDVDQNFNQLSAEIKDKSVLVIGGAGTIGSSFIKAILPYKPASLTVVDYSENGLTELTRDLRSQNIFMPGEYLTYPFDFGSKIFEKMFMAKTFDIVACFAAHKHVRSEKDHLAIEAMISNNVFNTHRLIELCTLQKPKHFFSVSTDKAANPVNVMGASKKLMENVLLAYSNDLKITTARFANVAFSNGSLPAGFIERIFKQQPLSSPSDVKRYFVSPEESGQLCMLACILGKSGDIFFPKLEETMMMTFSEIAERFLAEMNLKPDYCESELIAKEKAAQWSNLKSNYPVYFFKSDTDGEKSFEEFYTEQDTVELNLYHALGIVKNYSTLNKDEIVENVRELRKKFDDSNINKSEIVKYLSSMISNFHHIDTGKNLDSKM